MLRELIDIAVLEDFVAGLARTGGFRTSVYGVRGELIGASPRGRSARTASPVPRKLPSRLKIVNLLPAREPPVGVAFVEQEGLWTIVVPLSRAILVTIVIFTIIGSWNSFLWPLVMTNTPEMRPLQVGLAVFNQESGTDWELLMAASTFAILPLLVIFFLTQRQFIEGITRSGMKG